MSETRVLSVSSVSRITACGWIAAALLLPVRLPAQRSGLFRAGVADVATGAALTGAEVILPELRLHARADGTGFAYIPDVPRGRHRVRVRYLGYAPADLEILFQGDTTEVVFNLEMRPRTLDTVVVSEKRPDVLAPFADAVSMRYRMGIGRFLAGAQLAREENRDIDVVLTSHFPDLSTVPGPTPQSPTIVSRSGVASGFYTGKCPVRIFLDDWPLPDLSFVRTWDLAAIEYYTGGSAPAQYRTGRAVCGVLLLWSKR